MNLKHFALTAGEDRTLSLTATNVSGAVLNLTGATLTFKLARHLSDASVLDKTPSIVSAAAGTMTVSLTDSDTDDLSRSYVYQVTATISGTTTVTNRGTIKVGGLIGNSSAPFS